MSALVSGDAVASSNGVASGDRVAAIVKTVLYEGYALYPYRPSALKNQKRFAFGAVYPKAWAAIQREPFSMRAECVFEAETHTSTEGSDIEITVGCLLLHRGGGGTEHAIRLAPHPLVVAEWREVRAVERASTARRAAADETDHASDHAGSRSRTSATSQRSDGPVAIEIGVAIVDAGGGLWRVAVELDNVTPLDGDADREEAMDVTLASTHVLFRARRAAAISTIDPPPYAASAVASCRTLGCYPIVVARDTILASPIVLSDFPEIADQSPGDFFDGTEMDEMLTLRILTLTDEEKREAAASDPRIAALLARTAARGIEATTHLHGATRIGDGVPRAGIPSAAADLAHESLVRDPLTHDTSLRVAPKVGTRVRLRPHGRADSFDVILAGKRATIVGVDRDLDGRMHVAVTIDDDPGADLGADGMPGHRFYFRADELEVLR